MKLCDLKTGMVVEMMNGRRFLVVNDYFIADTGHMPFERYDENMICKLKHNNLDIMKVWTQKEMCNLNSMLRTDWLNEDRFGHLIWDRKNGDYVDMTIEEVCEALGKNVRIVKSK